MSRSPVYAKSEVSQSPATSSAVRARRPAAAAYARLAAFNRAMQAASSGAETLANPASVGAAPGWTRPAPLWGHLAWMPMMGGMVSPSSPARPGAAAAAPTLSAMSGPQTAIRRPLSAIRGFDQTNPAEYDSPAQAKTWGLSTCSAASLTAVLRAVGMDVRIADVMREMPNGMTPQLGLVSRPALCKAAAAFGATATDDVVGYEGLRQATESGQPVLVDIRNGKFPEGHWIVVTGVTKDGVQVADSSRYDLKFIPKDQFLASWSGKGIRVGGLPLAPSTMVA